MIMLSILVPMSLKFFMMVSRQVTNGKIQSDPDISGRPVVTQGTVVRHQGICDQLGSLDMVLSDKTGTLTQNSMTLRKVA